MDAQRPRVVPPPADLEERQRNEPAVPVVPPPPVVTPVPAPKADPAEVDAFFEVMQAQHVALKRRLTHRLGRDGVLRAEAMPGGAAGMNWLSRADHREKDYVRNPDLWAQDLANQLTGVSIYNTHTMESYGGVLITPRHLLFCAHAHPHAAGTWSVNREHVGATHRFLTTDGRLIESAQLHQAKSFGRRVLPDMKSVDLCVTVMDRDLEAAGLHVVPVFPPVSPAVRQAAMERARENGDPFAFFGVSQGFGRTTQSVPPEPIADYPREHARMVYIKDRTTPTLPGGEGGPFAAWDYRVWDGDSGTPAFLLKNGTVHLWMILTVAPGSGPVVGDHIEHVNALIALADENAIEQGRLDAPTGYRVRVGE